MAHGWWEITWPSWLVDGSQVVGAIVGTAALVIAIWALIAIGRERRLAHELEVLREMTIMGDGEQFGKADIDTLLVRLLLLRDIRDLPLTRVAVGLPSTAAARRQFAEQFPTAPTEPGWSAELDRFIELANAGVFNEEWRVAIDRRVGRSLGVRLRAELTAWLGLAYRRRRDNPPS